jgi:hypothetical protein
MWLFIWGYAPAVWRCEKLSTVSDGALLIAPEAEGHSPEEKERN